MWLVYPLFCALFCLCYHKGANEWEAQNVTYDTWAVAIPGVVGGGRLGELVPTNLLEAANCAVLQCVFKSPSRKYSRPLRTKRACFEWGLGWSAVDVYEIGQTNWT